MTYSKLFKRHGPVTSFLAGAAVVAATTVHAFLLPETIFLGGLLVWLPLVLRLSANTSISHDQNRVDRFLETAFWPCVAAAAASTFILRGPLSGAIAACWCGWVMAATAVSIIRFVRHSPRNLTPFIEAVSLSYLAVSALWFTCWRSVINPLDFPDGITLLTSIHFLYAGYLLPVIAIRLLPDSLTIRHRIMLSGMTAMMPVVGVGIAWSPTIEIIGVLMAVMIVLLFSAELLWMSTRKLQRTAVRTALALAGFCGAFAVGFAATYGVSEYTGNTWILIPTMIRWHGLLNSLGLIGGSLLAWAMIIDGEARSGLPSAIAAAPDRLSKGSSPNNFEPCRESYASTDSQSR